MKLLVISDNHGDEDILEEVLSIYEDDIDRFIHCGDSEMSDVHPLWQQYSVVKGNMDRSNQFHDFKIEKVKGKPFFITHGHLYNVKFSRNKIVEEAKNADSSFAFYGHSHIPKVEKIDDIYAINPGSISQPRGSFPFGTYCIVEVSDQDQKVTYYSRKHSVVKELPLELN